MPPVVLPAEELKKFGDKWTELGGRLSRSRPQSSNELGWLMDGAVASSIAIMVGGVPVKAAQRLRIEPAEPNCVETGEVFVIGGVRPQHFDVCYRPDGIRIAYDSKTLNDTKSVAKNYQNMINDLATEATNVHSRFPLGVVGFIVGVPTPCLVQPQRNAMIGTLERISGRELTDSPDHIAEAASLVVWDPATGEVEPSIPDPGSPLRIERFAETLERAYVARYKGLPPHAEIGEEAVEAEEEAETYEA
jgi:hypothetical protein